MIDLNDAESQREGGIIPDGTFAKISMALRPGGADIPGLDPMDNGLFKASGSSDVVMLDGEFTVVEGPFAKRKFWQMFTITGGQVDEKGHSKGFNITKSTIRAMIESAIGLAPDDMTDSAKAKRVFQAFKQLDGLTFYAKIGVEPGNEYINNSGTKVMGKDKNKLAHIVTVKDKEYAALSAGKVVETAPAVQAVPVKAATGPAWGNNSTAPVAQANTPAAKATASGPAWLRS